jgi:2-dehydro-3-deoxygalactonokinase
VIGVDWGTSSFRAYRMTEAGQIIARASASSGILQVKAGEFPNALCAAVGDWLADGETKILLSGMVGSRQGWVEAPYLPSPADPAAIGAALIRIPFDDADILLIPGLSDRDEAGTPEVMRGEETQIIGALNAIDLSGLVCLPGSHSKWARVTDGRIASFRTYFSGEAFAALRTGTILGRMMDDAPPDDAVFARGVARSADGAHLLHQLFGVRSLALFGELGTRQTASYLSGLLIGHEVRAALQADGTVHLIGAAPLCALYADAIAICGGIARVIDEDAAARGLARIGRVAPWAA